MEQNKETAMLANKMHNSRTKMRTASIEIDGVKKFLTVIGNPCRLFIHDHTRLRLDDELFFGLEKVTTPNIYLEALNSAEECHFAWYCIHEDMQYSITEAMRKAEVAISKLLGERSLWITK